MGCCGKIIAGATGLIKAGCQKLGLKVDKAADEVIEARRFACRTCPLITRNEKFSDSPNYGVTNLSRCTQCGCVVKAKTMIASEECPLGWWKAVKKS